MLSARSLLAVLALAAPAWALTQAVPAFAQPVVQATSGARNVSLNEALARLARNPRDVVALLDAGRAAAGMGDYAAAIGFYQRADQLAPGNAAVKAGLAGAMVRAENPFDAIPLFAEAEKAGASDAGFSADRGLAFDLVGDNHSAKTYYVQAIARGGGDEVVRRYALNQAIAGDRRGFEATLSPLLLKQDKAAWRARAFGLAILGQGEEAEAIAYATMPKDLAAGISPYLRYMPRLTPAQQAAAANFGHFPRAAEIGRDDPRVLAYAKPIQRTTLASADSPLVPTGKPLGKGKAKKDKDAKPAAPVRVAEAAPPPVPQPKREETTIALAAPVVAKPAPTPTPKPAINLDPPAAAPVAVNDPAPARVFATKPADPAPAAMQPAPTQPATATFDLAATPAAAPRPSLTDAFADLGRPDAEIAVAAGAVDVRRVTPVRPAPPTAKPAAKAPAKPAHPSRIWVQVATGRDKAALGFDWRRLAREDAAVFRGKLAYVSAWGQTNRLLTGPFETQAAANAYVAQLRRADVDGAFVWSSPAGQVVDALAIK